MIGMLWFLLPFLTTVASIAWAVMYPVEPGPYESPKRIGMLIFALTLCAFAWFLGALAK